MLGHGHIEGVRGRGSQVISQGHLDEEGVKGLRETGGDLVGVAGEVEGHEGREG